MARKHRVKPAVRRETEARLLRAARAAEVFVDGDAFKNVARKPELNTGDQYCVNHEEFIKVKQALLNIKRLEPGDVAALTWRPFNDEVDIVVPVDTGPLSVRPGNHPMTPEMKRALAGETIVLERTLRQWPLLCVLSPIRDSLDEVVGVTEVFASLVPDKFQAGAVS
jgi:hypothetical protein